jgi:hypothetical protein
MAANRNQLRQTAALEALRSQLHNLEETIASLIDLMKALPESDVRDRLFAEISFLDSISDVMRQALDSFEGVE